MIQKLQKITSFIRDKALDILAPSACAFCKSFLPVRVIFCSACKERIHPIVSRVISLTKTRAMRVFAISEYKDPLKSLILAKGWSDIVASHQLGTLLWQMMHLQQVQFDYIVPIPLHWTRFARRGFNQSEEMARVLAQKSGKQMVHLLHRTRRTQYQSTFDQDKRKENVSGAFALKQKNNQQYRGSHILLVDDLMTTGATLHAAARELLKVKPAEITSVVACRVI